MEAKVKCKICGKVGFSNDKKGLKRHYRLVHNEVLSEEANLLDYFKPTSQDAVVNIFSPTYKKKMKEKSRKRKRGASGLTILKNTFTRIIYTPMGNKR